jgi:PBP1b-binding outer membrane lipoprotein LpoB
MKNIIAIASFAAILLVSCTSKAPVAAAAPAATSTPEQIAQGKQFSKIHAEDAINYRIHLHNSVQWVGIMNSMAPKANLPMNSISGFTIISYL